jgi:hypothetical protein
MLILDWPILTFGLGVEIIVISGFGILLQSILWCLWVGGYTSVGQLFDFVNNLQI